MSTDAQFVPGQDGLYYPANRAAVDLASARKKLCLNAADLLEIKGGGTRVVLMNGEPFELEVLA